MTEGQTQQTNLPNTIAARLGEQGIKRVAIIDDAFDIPTRNDLETEGSINTFFAQVEADEDALNEVGGLGLRLNEASDITDEFIKKIYSERAKLTALRPYCNELFGSLDEKISQLKPLRESLKEDLGCEVDCLGREDELTNLSTKIIFIDYLLGVGDDAYEFAQKILKTTYGKYKDEPAKPLIILMSSKKISEETIAAFRDESGLLAGTFYFINKENFKNKEKMHLKLGAWILALPYSEKIQAFVNEIEASIIQVSEQFIKDIRKLSVDDYAYIQKLSLQDDGHPLGDYMIWLYSSYFGKLLFENQRVSEGQNVIDALTFNELPPSQLKPSLQLAEMYKSALFAVVADVGAHPREAGESEMMYLSLGDLFIKDAESDVWMIINAQCDLAYAPGASRQAKPERSIMMIPGKLNLLSKGLNERTKNSLRTELFEYNGATYRIIWDTKRVVTLQHGEVKGWKEDNKYKREARLRLPYALEIQRAFAADLTRVGMPVAPPIYQPVTLELFCADEDGKAVQLSEAADEAYMFLTRDQELCVLSEDFVIDLRQRLDTAKIYLKNRVQKLKEKRDSGEEVAKLRTWIAHIEELDDYEAILHLRIPFELPSSGEKKQLNSHPIIVSRKKNLNANSRYELEQPLTLVIKTI